MTKSGLCSATQDHIAAIVVQYATQVRLCHTAQIYAALYPGYVYDPACSSLRVTLSWMVRHGMLRRTRHGRLSYFYPASTREGQAR